ncbi:DUF490 domain-containing protein [Nitrogeniibacter mangrovi]|uniref:DUF490 domain-containing protein n=1 Tax=Nitrogeniibacter mangrovi TaxID=2016596 RepID=A0A6C1B2K5_9RHOO|nr:translocation/assembly module TamB domain-containing protein [Nitrogeniibacter mangrovi]QID17058.1 DUF490 domain-containing protein [Nitrogeniibacter mangrovi]
MSEAPPPQPHRRVLRGLIAVLAALVLLLAGGIAWLVGSASGLAHGTAWLAQLTQDGIRLEGARGRLIGPLQVDRVRVRLDTVHLDVDGLELDWSPAALLRGQLAVDALAARRVAIATPPGDGTPARAPAGVTLPLAIRLERFSLGTLALAPFPLADGGGRVLVSALSGRIEAGADRVHAVVDTVQTPWGSGGADLTLHTLAPMQVDGQARWRTALLGPEVSAEATLGGVLEAIEMTAKAEGGGAHVSVSGTLTPFAELPASALVIAGEGIDPARWRDALPAAGLSLKVSLKREAGRLVGPVSIANAAPGRLDQQRLPLGGLDAELALAPQAVALDTLALSIPQGGRLTGKAHWSADAPAGAEVALEGVNLKAIDARLPATALRGPVTLDADGGGERVQAALADAGLTLDLKARHAGTRVVIEQADLKQGQASAAITGTVTLEGAMPFEARVRTRAINPRAFWAEAPEGAVSVALEARGEAATPRAEGRYTIADSRLAGQPLSGTGQFAWHTDRLAKADLSLALGQNRLTAQGAWGAPADRLDWHLDAPQLAALGQGFAGALTLDGQLTGGRSRPVGTAQGQARALVVPGGVRIGQAKLSAELDTGEQGRFAVDLEARAIDAGPRVQLTRVDLTARGSRGEHVIDLSVKAPEDGGHVQLRGGLDKGQTWQGRLSELTTTGRLPLALSAPVTLSLAADQVRIGAGTLSAGQRGTIAFAPTRWSPGRLSTSGQVSGLTLGLETRPDARPKRGGGDLVLGGKWDLDFDQQAHGTVHLFRESGDLILTGDTVVRFGLSRFDVLASLDGRRLALGVDAAGSALGELSGSATAQLKREGGVWQLDMQAPLLGSADLDIPSIAWIGPLASPVVRTDGRLKAAFSLSGTPADPVGAGQISGQGLLLELVGEGLRLAGGTLDARFDAERLDIDTLRFVSESRVRPRDSRVPYAALTRTPGTLSAHGSLRLADGEGGLDIEADRLPLFQRADRWLAVSGKGRMDTRWEAPRIEASVVADGGYLEFARTPAPSLSGDVKVLGREATAPPSQRQLKARIAIDLGRQLYLSALGLDTRLGGQLVLVANSGEPLRATGSLETVGGTYEGYGQKLVIERGVVNFQGPLDNPGLNVVALRKGLAVEAGVSIAGTVRRPVVSLVSTPEVPDAEKLSWIVLGRAPEGGSGDAALLLPAAQALLGGPGGGISDQLAAGLGLDELSIGQGELNSVGRTSTSSVVGGGSAARGEATVSGQVLSVGKRLSADTTLSFEQSLSGVEHVVKLTHQLTRRLAVIGRAGTDNAVDLRWSLSFR